MTVIRKLSVLLLVAVMLLSATAAVADDKPVEVTLITWGQQAAYEAIVEGFNKSQSAVHATLEVTPIQQYFVKLNSSLGAGVGCDVFWMNIYFHKYSSAGMLANLDEFIARDNYDLSVFQPEVVESLYYNGSLYGMPKGMDSMSIAYNKDIFDKYGIAYPESGWTWDEFVAKATEVKEAIEKAGGYEYALALDLTQWSHCINHIVVANGGSLYSEDEKTCTFNEQAVIDTFKDLKALIDAGIQVDYSLLSEVAASDLFISEQVAMISLPSINAKASAVDATEVAAKTRLVTMPIGKSGNNNIGILFMSYAMNPTAANKDAAWELLKYLGSYEANKILGDYHADFPALKEAQPSFLKSFTALDGQVFIDQLQHASMVAYPPVTPTAMNIVSEYIPYYFTGEMTVEDMAKAVDDGIQALLDAQ